MIARRTEKHLAEAAQKRVERWRRIAREASEQSRRSTPPEITAPMKLYDALLQVARSQTSVVIPTEGSSPSGGTCFSPGGEVKIVLAETERTLMLADILHSREQPQSLTLAVGPEGGWTPEELQTFAAAQFIPCSLGDTILRAETAAIAALAIARAEL